MKHQPLMNGQRAIDETKGAGAPLRYYARCACGWVGPPRMSARHTDEDITNHVRGLATVRWARRG